jgi:hypothetical protein
MHEAVSGPSDTARALMWESLEDDFPDEPIETELI